MSLLVSFLSNSPLVLMFAVIGVGFLLGSIRIAGFSLGPAAVLFAGIIFGAIDSRLRIPDLVYVFGLVLFVYTIGLQSGPTFFSSFGKRSVRANITAFAILLGAALIALVAHWLTGMDAGAIAGAFCGALTNTPALAASLESLKAVTGAASNAPVIGYSVAYPFGVIGVLLSFYALGKIDERRQRKAGERTSEPSRQTPISRTFRVANAGAVGVPVADLLAKKENKGFLFSRLRRGSVTTLVAGDTTLEKGDLVVAVGTPSAVERARVLLGEDSPLEIQFENNEFDFRRVEVSDPRVVGKSIEDLDLQNLLEATVTRVRRGDTDFVPTPETVLERGDRIRVLTWVGNMERLVRFFGDSVKHTSETDFLSLSIGLVFGVLIGMIPLPLPGGGVFTLGFAGGPLVVGLLLGWQRRLGPIVWGMPYGVNLTLRQFGLVLFLSGIGTKAGDGFVQTVLQGGWKLMGVGAVITVAVTFAAMVGGRRLLGLSFPAAMGLMSGIQTQPACLAYANEHANTNAPNVWYASVYPVSMIAKIIFAQLLIGWMLR